MESHKIFIPKTDIFHVPNDIEEATRFYDFLRAETKNKEILALKKKVWEIIRKSEGNIEQRFNLFYGTLLRCWKVIVNDEHIAYMYPYMLNDVNRYLFCLYSPTDHSNNYFVAHNGLYEESIDTMDWMVDRDVTLVECSIDEMLENAKMMCEKCLKRRLEKIEKSKKE